MKDTGGSAFPKQPIWRTPAGTEVTMEQSGMTLRDYFAASVASGMLHSYETCGSQMAATQLTEIATDAYSLADAMLTERAK